MNPHLHEELQVAARRSGPLGIALEPIGKNVAIIPEDPDKVTPGGIILPDTARQRTIKGTVFSVGPDVSKAVEVGDVVYLPDHGGDRLTFGKDIVLVYSEDDLLAKETK